MSHRCCVSQLGFEANEIGGNAGALRATSQLQPKLFSRIFLEPQVQRPFLFIFPVGSSVGLGLSRMSVG